jgi:hypothetical protein
VPVGAHISISDWTSLVGLAFAALAAFFAGRAVHYARQTVKDGATASEAAATRHAAQIAEMRSLLTATHNAHEEEASDRRRLYDHDLIIRRVAQMQRISEVLADLIDATRAEWTNPTPRYDLGSGRMLAATPIMALQERLRLEVQVLESLGGPKIADWVPPLTRDDDVPGLQRLWTSEGLTALERIKGMLQGYEALQPDSIFDRDHESTRQVPTRLSDGPEKFSA